MISEEFLEYYMWSFIATCFSVSIWIWIYRYVKERRRERAAFASALRQKYDLPRKRPYNWAKEKNT